MLLDHRRFLAGDPTMASRFRQAARQWTRRYFDDPDKIDSIVQAALLEMLGRLRAGEEPEPDRIAFWIRGCTNNVVRRELTRMRNADFIGYESHLHGRAPVDMSQTLRLRREIEHVERGLDDCEDQARRIFEERVRGAAYREIAATQAVSEEAARASVSKLRKRLLRGLSKRDKVEYLKLEAKRAGLVDQHSVLPPKSSNLEQ
jgi:DNA-directed RNA polymerase specialized sigma24 family protein